MSSTWLRSLVNLELRPAKTRRRPARPHGSRFLPRMEALEGRWMPATLDGGLGDGLGDGVLGGGSSAVGLGSVQPASVPIVLPVQNLNDSGPGSLREAILYADTLDGVPYQITFAPGLGGSINLLSALPDLQGTIDLEGPGAGRVAVKRSADPGIPAFAIFNVPYGATVTVTGLTIANGKAPSGGGISSVGNLTVDHCIISGNTATGLDGGGIFSNGGSLTITDSTISGNSAPTAGAGIFNGATHADITNCTIAGNLMAVNGAGIYNNYFSSLTLINCTIAGNHAANVGGGLANFGLANYGYTVTLMNATISGNTATSQGGGVFGPLTARNTLIAGNTCVGSPDVNGAATSLGHNLIGDGSGSTGFTATGDIVGSSANPINPHLGPLQDDGGPTQTMALLSGSPAIDAGDPNNFPATDQRGVQRPQPSGGSGSALPDIGALEANLFASTPVLAPVSDSGIAGDRITSVNRPTFTGTAGTGTTVTLLEGSTVLGSATADKVTGAWSITSTTLGDGAHNIAARATDALGHTGGLSAASRVVIDTRAPTSTVAFPGSGTYDASSWTGSLSGGSSDAASGLQSVRISVRQVSTGLFWAGNGNGFTSPTEVFVTPQGTSFWLFAFPSSNFPSGGSYTVHAQATDGAGNVEAGPMVTFVYNLPNPLPPPPPTPTPVPSQPVVREIRPQLSTVKVGKRRKRVVQVFFTDTGALEREFAAPFQDPKYKGFTLSVQASGSQIVVSAHKGKKTFARTFPA